MAGARFHQINLIVSDMHASLDFYRRVGIELPEDGVWRTDSGPHLAGAVAGGDVGFQLDSRRLAKAYNAGFAAERGRVMIGVALESRAAVDALWHELISEGVQGLQPPYDAFWGARLAIVEDPDGNPVSLASPVDPALRAAPPRV
jgi:catechol 2,3-dioxygenase-like lactoylglutathione lyase family enzyme